MVERFARGYEDYLQCPLQPLMDNLESGTYEVFEKDPIKYAQYQFAIQEAITDIASIRKFQSQEEAMYDFFYIYIYNNFLKILFTKLF